MDHSARWKKNNRADDLKHKKAWRDRQTALRDAVRKASTNTITETESE